jgi:Tol biopolymer transport system component
VAFISDAINLVPGTTVNGHAYVRNLATGVTTLIDQTPVGGESSRAVQSLKLAAGGRYAVFTSDAGDLVPGDTNNHYDVFRRDLQTGTTIRLSVLPNGDELPFGPLGNGDYELDISADGRGVLFRSFFDLTTDGSENAHPFLYYRDVNTGVTRLIAGNAQYASAYSAISDNGKWIVYSVGVPPPATQSVNLYDLEADDLYTMYDIDQSAVSSGLQRQGLSVSNDGRYIAFAMLGLGGSSFSHVYVVDRNNPGVPILASTGTSGAGDGHSAYPRLSGDGRYVAFSTDAPNLTAGQAWSSNFFLGVRDLVAATTTIGSRKFNGTDVALGASGDHGYAISGDGSTLTFLASYAAVNGGGTNTGNEIFAGPRP